MAITIDISSILESADGKRYSAYRAGNAPVGGGGSVTLTGTGFGTGNVGFTWSDKTDYQLANGTEIPVGSIWRQNGDTWDNAFSFDTSVKVGGRAGSITAPNKSAIFPVNGAKTEKLYASWMLRFDCNLTDLAFFTQAQRSDKVIRVWDGEAAADTWISWTQQHLTYNDTPGGTSAIATSWNDLSTTPNQWHRMEFYVDPVAKTIQAWKDGVLTHNVTDFEDENALKDFYIQLFGYDMSQSAHIAQSFNTWLAELYRLPSLARVEVSDSATWNGGQITRYLQDATSWIDTEITFDLFRGDFSEATQLYAYIVKADGSVVSGGAI